MSETNTTCVMCPRIGHLTCAYCNDAKYCSRDCQQLDARNHDILCAAFRWDPRPTPAHRRTLLFPGGFQDPRFEWIEVPQSEFPFGTEHEAFHVIGYNDLQGRSLDSGPGVRLSLYNHAELGDRPIGIERFTRGGACCPGIGSAVSVIRTDINAQCEKIVSDITMRDVRNAADRLGQYNRNGHDQKYLRDMLILGTTISAAAGPSPYDKMWMEVVMNGCDSIWSSLGSTIANLLGLPLLYRTDSKLLVAKPDPGLRNDHVALLYLDVVSPCVLDPADVPNYDDFIVDLEPSARPGVFENSSEHRQLCVGLRGYGSFPARYSHDTTGRAYLMRADHKPFPPQHAQALCSFIRDVIVPKVVRATSGLRVHEAVPEREEILRFITRAEFQRYYEWYSCVQIKNGDQSWIYIPDPYTINHQDMASTIQETLGLQQAMGIKQQSEQPVQERREPGITIDDLLVPLDNLEDVA